MPERLALHDVKRAARNERPVYLHKREVNTKCVDFYSNGTINSATMLMILISGLIAGPAVSL